MKNTAYIRNTFVRQLNDNDCGIACMRMILNYAGKGSFGNALSNHSLVNEKDLSLLELKKFACNAGLHARCVEMELQFLRALKGPCILYMADDYGRHHFQVCYGATKKRSGYEYLMADPARHIFVLREEQLVMQWVDNAAICFEGLTHPTMRRPFCPWAVLITLNLFPSILCLSIPLLNIYSAVLGVALSWMLEKGMNEPVFNWSSRFLAALVLLLFVIILFRGVFSYVKQRILITINANMNEQLFFRLLHKLGDPLLKDLRLNERSVKMSMSEIQKIQRALHAFISVLLSDGLLVICMLSASFYLMPAAGVVNSLYLILTMAIAIFDLPELLFGYAHLQTLEAGTRREIINELNSGKSASRLIHPLDHKHGRYLKFARFIAIRISKVHFLYDCLGALNVVFVISLCFMKLRQQLLPYSTLIILSFLAYIISALTPKIANVVYVIAEGAEAARQFNDMTNHFS